MRLDCVAGQEHLRGDLGGRRAGGPAPPLALMSRPAMSAGRKIGMSALWLHLGVAMILVIVKIVQLALGY